MPLHRVNYKELEQVPKIKINKNFKSDFFGSSPAPFIGRFNYPHINIGLLSPQFPGDTSHYDSPQLWSKGNFKINTIAGLRYGLVNSRSQCNVKMTNSTRLLEICQEVGMADKSVELEINLTRTPQLKLSPSSQITPFGPVSEIKKVRITSNPHINQHVEKIVSDTDLRAIPALLQLYKKGFEESFLNKILSVGNLGLKKNRKLVPTRWSITAVDDALGKELIKEIKNNPLGEYQLYFGGGWGNYYLILLFPEPWSFELFETYLHQNINPWSKNNYAYSTDYENYIGRKDYAEECAGGYYAARFPVLEKIKECRKQFSALVFRFITPKYEFPLGVWICREASRKSLQSKPLTFSNAELMFKYACELTLHKFSFDLSRLLSLSQLLKEKKEQKKITDYLM